MKTKNTHEKAMIVEPPQKKEHKTQSKRQKTRRGKEKSNNERMKGGKVEGGVAAVGKVKETSFFNQREKKKYYLVDQ